MNKPSLNDLENNYKNYLLKIRDGRLCCVCIGDNNSYVLVDNEYLNHYLDAGAITTLTDYRSDLTAWSDIPDYDIVAVYYSVSELKIIRCVLLQKEPEKWDWKEIEEIEEMTLSEVCNALGKNIKNYKGEVMYKVGDIVRGNDKITNDNAIGVRGTIIDTENNNLFLVRFDECLYGHDGYNWWCKESEITLVTDELKFKIGDLVRIKETEYRKSYKRVFEKVGTIVDAKYERLIDDERITYKVKVNNEINEWETDGLWVFYDENSLEFAKADDVVYPYILNSNYGITKTKCLCLDDKIKGENNMDNIIEIYKARKREKITKKYNQMEQSVKMADPRYKVWKDCSDTINKMYEEDENSSRVREAVKLTKATLERLGELLLERTDEYDKVCTKADEVEAQLQMCETYDQKQEILRRYNIINKNGKINA